MTLHVFANIVTPFGTAANNRGETDGSNATTLHKLVWQGRPHTTVSAEAIRFSLRKRLAGMTEQRTNRQWNEQTNRNEWVDPSFVDQKKQPKNGFIDDDLLGYMSTEAGRQDGEGPATIYRGRLEVTRAISLTDWRGDIVHQFASPGAAVRNGKPDAHPAPYVAEIHATRYQYGLAMTPSRLRDPDRAAIALRALATLGTVAGNHSRFLFDFSPASIVLRITDDPAPRLLYCFETADDGKTVDVPALLERVAWGDIDASELVLGGEVVHSEAGRKLREAGAWPAKDVSAGGVKAAVEEACQRIDGVTAGKGA